MPPPWRPRIRQVAGTVAKAASSAMLPTVARGRGRFEYVRPLSVQAPFPQRARPTGTALPEGSVTAAFRLSDAVATFLPAMDEQIEPEVGQPRVRLVLHAGAGGF